MVEFEYKLTVEELNLGCRAEEEEECGESEVTAAIQELKTQGSGLWKQNQPRTANEIMLMLYVPVCSKLSFWLCTVWTSFECKSVGYGQCGYLGFRI